MSFISTERARCPSCHRWVPADRAECPTCGAVLATRPGTRLSSSFGTYPAAARRQLYVSFGLLVAVLGLWAGGVYLVSSAAYYSSPEYKVKVEVVAAEKLLAPDDGRSARPEQLYAAYEHYLNALSFDPTLDFAYDRLDAISWRYAEQHSEVPIELRRRLALTQAHAPRPTPRILPIMPSDRWNLGELADIPRRAVKVGLFGGSLIVAAWIYFMVRRSLERAQRRLRRG